MIDHVLEVRHVGAPEVVRPGPRPRPLEGTRRMPSSPSAPGVLEDPVRLVLDPARDVGVGRAAVGRVVLEAAVLGRVVRRRDDDAVGEAAPARPRLATRIACDTAGVGVKPSSASTRTSTPFATRTSSAVRHAGSDSACVSRPMNSGPVYPFEAR